MYNLPKTGGVKYLTLSSAFLVVETEVFKSNTPFHLAVLEMKLLHENIYQKVLDRLLDVYKQVKIGNPLEKGTLLRPLHTRASRENFEKGIQKIKSQLCAVAWPVFQQIIFSMTYICYC
ncbi:unnamed protein product [Fraxinus pennsylvanica]|uniref:Aldehyde dehydrogenase domain-containing protein n=1 Tax=Fraxinus pennsylvanica TaxID=56036 RepID=A0AAD1YUW1_9LAMI|nr:unnamed protein product [Fraxinus pennsylvanica]